LGNPHILGLYFVKNATANVWDLYTNLDGGAQTSNTQLVFNSAGALIAPASSVAPQTWTLANGATTPMSFNLDLTGSTQFGNIFGVNRITQDGYTSGRLSGLSVSADGTVQGRYTNGQTRNLAEIVLGKFNNPNGLLSIGGNQWQETSASGQPLIGVPGSGALGALQSAAIEESNVDLTAELVNMITAQRAYQANAQTIKTQDQILQTLVNLR
jgi:flagellar hook protein FlgE